MNSKNYKNISMYVLLIAAMFFLANMMWSEDSTTTIKYSELVEYFEDDNISDFSIDFGTGEMTYMLNGEEEEQIYSLPSITIFLEDISDYIAAYNEENPDDKITYDYIPAEDTPWWYTMLPTFLLIAALAVFWIYMLKQSGGGGKAMSFGKVKIKPTTNKDVSFADVAGADEEKEELEEIVEFLKNPKRYNELGAKIPKGVMLVGPPGTGKTLLAKAVAGEAGVPFFSISGSNFVEMFVGVGASRVRDLFEQAKKEAPSIVFIDEIDAVGRQRGAGLGGGHDEREQTLNQLLVEMDGFEGNVGVIVIAATNRRDVLDPALLRPGRFDRQVIVNYPDVKGREEILKVHAKNKPLAPDVDLSVIAKSTPGFTGADLANLLNEGALLSARRGLKAITMAEVQEATIKVIAGPEKRTQVINEEDKKLTAYHEAGHAVATYFCSTQSPVHQISVIPRGMAGGYTLSLPDRDTSYKRKKEMYEDLIVLLGGRVAEELVLDDISTGASNDLERATAEARSMITKYGFSEKLGNVVYGDDHSEVFLGRDFTQSRNYSEQIASEIDTEVRDLIDKAHSQVKSILSEHMDKLEIVAKALIEFEKIDAEQFKNLMEFSGKEEEPVETVEITEQTEE